MKKRKKRKNGKRVFALRLKQAMALRDITQTELSKRTGFSQANISHYVNSDREPAIGNLLRFAEVLEVSTDYLTGNNHKEKSLTRQEGSFLSDIKKLNSYHLKILYDFLELLLERQRKR